MGKREGRKNDVENGSRRSSPGAKKTVGGKKKAGGQAVAAAGRSSPGAGGGRGKPARATEWTQEVSWESVWAYAWR
jgi:hypothetical protein